MSKVSIIIPVFNAGDKIQRIVDSLNRQTYREFEVIFINDGSTDNSKDILDQYVRNEKRFHVIHQENRGVSMARNAGLDIATGKYICFWDADDTVPKYALKVMVEKMQQVSADMVIGAMKRIGTTNSSVYQKTKLLANKKYIEKSDLDLVYSFSLANKMLKRDLIEEHHVRFKPIKHAEDGVFLYEYLQYCNVVCGCEKIVYHYHREMSFGHESATQAMNDTMLTDVLKALNWIEEYTFDYGETFQQELLKRALQVTLLGEYYRKIWRLQKTTQDLLLAKILEYKERMPSSKWQEITDGMDDLALKDGIKDRKEIAKSPLLSVIVTEQVSEKHLPIFVDSLYKQQFPNYEVLVEETRYAQLEEAWKQKENMVCVSKERLFEEVKGKYLTVVDADILYCDNTLLQMYQRLVRSDMDCIAVSFKEYTNAGEVKPLKMIEALYSRRNIKRGIEANNRNIETILLANKCYRSDKVNSLQKCMQLHTKNLRFQRFYHPVLLVKLNDFELERMTDLKKGKINQLYICGFFSIMERRLIQMIKRLRNRY